MALSQNDFTGSSSGGGQYPINRKESKFWKEEIKAGQRFQTVYGRSGDWELYKNYYRHSFKQGTLPLNLVFAHLRALLPQTYFKNPRVSVISDTPGYHWHARILEKCTNKIIREQKIKQQLRRMIMDASLCGIGVGVCGYDSQFGYDPALIDPRLPGNSTMSMFAKNGDRIEYHPYAISGMPWFMRARPDDVIFPFGCTSIENAAWVAIRYIRPLDDLRADEKYMKRRTKELRGTYQIQRTDENGSALKTAANDSTVIEYVELWEIRDLKNHRVRAIATGYPELLRDDDDDLQLDGLPIKTLIFNEDPDIIYGIPDARIIEPQQLEVNELRAQLRRHRQLSMLKFLYSRGTVKDVDVEKFLSSDNVAIPIQTDGAIGDAIKDMNHQIPQDLYLYGQQLESDIRYMLGQNRNQAGEYQGKSHVTKAEVDEVSQSSLIRVDERRDMVADLLVEISDHFQKTIFRYWDVQRVEQVIGPDGAKLWIQFSGAELQGKYTNHIDANEARSVDPQSRKRDAVELAQMWGGLHPGVPVPQELERYLYQQYEGIDMETILAQVMAQQQLIQQAQMSGHGDSENNAIPISDIKRAGDKAGAAPKNGTSN